MVKLEDQDWVINPNTGNKIDMKKLLTEQRLALIYVDSRFPFFSTLLRQLTWIYTFQVPTQATDGTRLLVNPEFTSGLSIKMKAFVMMHECMHCSLDHMKRGKNHDHTRSNVAGDYEVNGLLEQDGIVSAADLAPYLFDKKYQNMAYEHIYAICGSQSTPPPQKGGQQGSGDPQGGGQGQQQQGQGGGGQGQSGSSAGQGQGQGGGSTDKEIDKMSGKEAAEDAQKSADRAKQSAAEAQKSSDRSTRYRAKDAADRAQQAADDAKEAAANGDDARARQKAKEARDAANEAQDAANQANQEGKQGNGKGKGQQGDGNSQASAGARKEAAEACGSVGGFIDQATGAEIARSEGYGEEDCKVKTVETISQDWKDAAIEACSKNNSPGKGYIVSHFKDYYLTAHDWKGELKKYVGRALSNVEDETKLGKKKWLAQGEIKKFNTPSSDGLDSVIFLIDCSGSVSDKLLQNIISECWTICVKKKIRKVTYCYYDDGIRQMETNDTMHANGVLNPDMVTRIKRGNARPIADIHGRGGNEEDQVMEEITKIIKQSHKKPELCMWFTDGYTYARPVKPSCIKHMIWVIYDNNNFEVKDNSRVIHIASKDLGK